jgi:hypothetical protein
MLEAGWAAVHINENATGCQPIALRKLIKLKVMLVAKRR